MTVMEAPATEEAEEPKTRRHHRLLFEFCFALGAVLLITLILSILGRHAGWPNNDERTTQAFETQIYAAHFRQFDFLPVWSGSDAYGLGSPLPIYYHKAFFMLSGTLFLLLGNIKAALVASIAAFMVVGVYGMRTAAGVITDRKVLIVVSAYGFIFTNYAFTDWLVRGDLAEFSAMMLIPWLLWWCLKLVARRSASFAVIPIMVLLVYAHNLIGLSAIIPIALALATFLFFNGSSGMRAVFQRMVISTAVVIALLSPLLVAELGFNSDYDPASKAIQVPFLASRNFVHPVNYFWNSGFHWLTDFSNRTPFLPNSLAVQIDFAIWVPIAVALPFLLILVVRRRGSFHARLSSPVAVFLALSLVVFLFLQFPISGPVYRIFHPLEVLQFPWRLLAYITPLGILAVVAIAESLRIRARRVSPAVMPTLSVAWLGGLIFLSPVFATFQNYGFIPSKALVAPTYQTYGRRDFLYGAEYLPQVGKQSSYTTWVLYLAWYSTHNLAEPLPAGAGSANTGGKTASHEAPGAHCSVDEPRTTKFESLQIRLTVTCSRPTLLALPISYNPYTALSVQDENGRLRSLPYLRVKNDPRIVIRVTSTKPERLLVELPTIWRVLFG